LSGEKNGEKAKWLLAGDSPTALEYRLCMELDFQSQLASRFGSPGRMFLTPAMARLKDERTVAVKTMKFFIIYITKRLI
jgi:hypothetical protein